MAYNTYLMIDDIILPHPDEYSVDISEVVSDSSGETEAGTRQRDVIRNFMVSISVSFSVSSLWLKKLSAFKIKDKLNVKYFDTEKLELIEKEMYMDSFSAKLYKDTSKKGLWQVSFKLEEF